MEKLNALLGEYNNLWQEKIIHKQSIRKFHYYITYLTTVGSLALTFVGLSPVDIFQGKAVDKLKFLDNPFDMASLILIPLLPIILLILSFGINDLFHIYAIGTQLGIIEIKINKLIGINKLLTWEHIICPFVYGGKLYCQNNKEIFKVDNLIKKSDLLILLPFVSIVCIASFIFGIIFSYNKFNYYLSFIKIKANILSCTIYLSIIFYFLISSIYLGIKLNKYVSYESDITKGIRTLNNIE